MARKSFRISPGGVWHVLASVSPQGWRTECGRVADPSSELVRTRPVGEHACTSCLRAMERREEGG